MTWLRRLLHRRRLERELDAELRFHVDQQIADHVRTGLPADDASRRARLSFGGLDQIKEECRDVRGARWLIDLGRDMRAAARSLRATPGFTAVAVLVLTLGIGASTAIFSVVDAVVLRRLPFNQPDRLVAVHEFTGRGAGRNSLTSPQNYADWKAATDVFGGLAAIRLGGGLNLRRDGDLPAELLRGNLVTSEFFSVLRVSPVLGRVFGPDDEIEGHDGVAVISYGFWQRRYGGAADVIGKRLHDIERTVEIVGVLPRDFEYPPGEILPNEVWTPYVVPANQRTRPGNGRYWNLQPVGRLRDGVTVQQAQQRLDAITASIIAAYPDWSSGMRGVRVQPLHDAIVGDTRPWMLLLLGAVAFVLILACVNVANLLLVRATTRSRELAVRAALGATRWDLARALLAESVVLSGVGVVCGVALAWWGVGVLRDAMPLSVPRAAAIAVDLRVLAVAIVAGATTGVLFGLVPAIPFSRPGLNGMMKDGGRTLTSGRTRQSLRTSFVIVEVALAVVLLVASGLFLTSFARVTRVDLGMNIDKVLIAQITPPRQTTGARGRLDRALGRAASLPGVDAAALAELAVPMAGGRITYPIRLAGQRQDEDSVGIDKRSVSPDYFRVLQIPLTAGRFFTAQDDGRQPPVVILNQKAARRYFGDERIAVGQRVDVANASRLVVGVVGDVRQFGPEQAVSAAFFMPFAQSDAEWGELMVRTSHDPQTMLPAVKAAIWQELPDALVTNPDTIRSILDRQLAARRFNMLLLGLFGAIGLSIAALGVYGVVAYVVKQRTQEIGIRVTLGATPAAMMRSVLSRTLIVLSVGVGLGLLIAFRLETLATKFLFQVAPHEAGIYAAAGTALAIAGLLAAFVPARRAAHVDPLIALRSE